MKHKKICVSIFISSTFRDMQLERDILRDLVLPRVREFAAKYGNDVELIDLRWGVDTSLVSEEEQNRKVLRTCLDEIERSRPFFVCLLGERYGWIPPLKDMEASLKNADIAIDIGAEKSITALEIECGVFYNTAGRSTNLFYFRNSDSYEMLTSDRKEIYIDNSVGRDKLRALKERIAERYPEQIHEYKAEIKDGDMAALPGFADMLADDLCEMLRDEWGEAPANKISWQEREELATDSYRYEKTSCFVARTDLINELVDFCLNESEHKIYLLHGEDGLGKSAALCKVMEQIEEQCLLLPFCCGVTPLSSVPEDLLKMFIWRLERHLTCDFSDVSEMEFYKLKDRFYDLLETACAKTKVVAVVTSMESFAGSDEAERMLWINRDTPENFRLLCSVSEGASIETVKRLDGIAKPFPPVAEDEEKASIIRAMAAQSHKQLPDRIIQAILEKKTSDGKPASNNLLYLRLIVQYLVMAGRNEHECIDAIATENKCSVPIAMNAFFKMRIETMGGSPEAVFFAIIDRMESCSNALRDGGQSEERSHNDSLFLHIVLLLIAVTRYGLQESHFPSIFAMLKMEFNPADFSWVRVMMKGILVQRNEMQWAFAYKSIQKKLLEEQPEAVSQISNTLVERYFHNLESIPYSDTLHNDIMRLCYLAGRPEIAATLIAITHSIERFEIEESDSETAKFNVEFGEKDDILLQAYMDDISRLYQEINSFEEENDFVSVMIESAKTFTLQGKAMLCKIIGASLPLFQTAPPAYRIRILLKCLSLFDEVSQAVQNLLFLRFLKPVYDRLILSYEIDHDYESAQKYMDIVAELQGEMFVSNNPKGNKEHTEHYMAYERAMSNHHQCVILFKPETYDEFFALANENIRLLEGLVQTASRNDSLPAPYELLSLSYDLMAGYWRNHDDMENELLYLEKRRGIEHQLDLSDPFWAKEIIEDYSRMGVFLDRKALPDEAHIRMKKAFEMAEELYDKQGTPEAAQLLSHCCTILMRSYIKADDVEESTFWAQRKISAINKESGKMDVTFSAVVIASIYDSILLNIFISENDIPHAVKCAEAAAEILAEAASESTYIDGIKGLIRYINDAITERFKSTPEFIQYYWVAAIVIYERICLITKDATSLADLFNSYGSRANLLFGRFLTGIADEGQINDAEDILFTSLEVRKDDFILRAADKFYKHLDSFSDEKLKNADYSREEIHEGWEGFQKHFGNAN